ncbi:hypothetical protein PM10SUCC1_32230 [Propionigenium maris DSM 9537]|uniref:Uncharacterized protein n=1 Tax=Propionigenium maris DSM 9537 TaxID=1123000 RepID=A0A9W6LP76_9FUSO|nr:hypothetical protein [Propionigenium maris]GLI57709.1 hypothetical protein PM10SUCC1_32230 [Propionigenium maris DSM 9537]
MKVDGIWREVPALKGTFWNKDPEETILFVNTLNSPTEEEAKDFLPLEPRKSEYRSVSVNKIWVKTLTGKEVELSISGFISSNSGDGSVPTELTEQVNGNTEQLQNCTQALDSSIVAYIGPQGISGNVVGANPINVGGNVIEGDGVSFVKSEDGFGIGEGYENIITPQNYSTKSTVTKNGAGDYTFEILDPNSCYITVASPNTVDVISTYSYGFYFDMPDNITLSAHTWTGTFDVDSEKGELTATGVNNQTATYIKIDGAIVGDKIRIKKAIYSKTGNKVPFVPHSFRGGELVIGETWDSFSHTFISYNKGNQSTSGYVLDNIEGRYHSTSSGSNIGKDYICIISKGKIKTYHIGGTMQERDVYNSSHFQGLKINKSSTNPLNANPDLICFLALARELTIEEELQLIDIIESGNYTLPPHLQGTTFPIEGMVRRGDKYGIVNPYVFAAAERLLAYTGEDHDFEVLVEGESALKVVSVTAGVSSDPSVIRVDGNEIVANVNLKKFRRI